MVLKVCSNLAQRGRKGICLRLLQSPGGIKHISTFRWHVSSGTSFQNKNNKCFISWGMTVTVSHNKGINLGTAQTQAKCHILSQTSSKIKWIKSFIKSQYN